MIDNNAFRLLFVRSLLIILLGLICMKFGPANPAVAAAVFVACLLIVFVGRLAPDPNQTFFYRRLQDGAYWGGPLVIAFVLASVVQSFLALEEGATVREFVGATLETGKLSIWGSSAVLGLNVFISARRRKLYAFAVPQYLLYMCALIFVFQQQLEGRSSWSLVLTPWFVFFIVDDWFIAEHYLARFATTALSGWHFAKFMIVNTAICICCGIHVLWYTEDYDKGLLLWPTALVCFLTITTAVQGRLVYRRLEEVPQLVPRTSMVPSG